MQRNPLSNAAILSLALLAAPALAQAEAGAVRTYSLSPEQKAKLLETGTERSAEAAQADMLGGVGPDRAIHGEVAAMIGTGGARGIAGTAAIPLGENGGAIISFEKSRYDYRRR